MIMYQQEKISTVLVPYVFFKIYHLKKYIFQKNEESCFHFKSM